MTNMYIHKKQQKTKKQNKTKIEIIQEQMLKKIIRNKSEILINDHIV